MQGLWMWSSPVERLNADGSKYHLVRAATLSTTLDKLQSLVAGHVQLCHTSAPCDAVMPLCPFCVLPGEEQI